MKDKRYSTEEMIKMLHNIECKIYITEKLDFTHSKMDE